MPRPKRQKTDQVPAAEASVEVTTGNGRRNLRGRRGSLKMLLEMPLDILYDIFSCMHPMDLLNLARTNKDFRSLLMNKLSANLWRASRATVEGLPECPRFLSEPAYANLAFDGHCYNCFKPAKHVIWEFLVRYCNKCKDEMTTSSVTVFLTMNLLDNLIVPNSMVCLIRDKHRQTCMHVPDEANVLRKYQSLTEDERPGFVQDRRDLVRDIEAFVPKAQAWYRTKQHARSEELETIRKNRLQGILQRLRDIGWADELERLKTQEYAPLMKIASVRLSKPLTDRTWQTMRGEVIRCMENVKARRLRVERVELLKSRMVVLKEVLDSVHPGYEARKRGLPPLVEWAMMPQIQVILDTPDNVTVDKSHLGFLKDDWSTLSQSWREGVVDDLRNLARKYVVLHDDVDPLSLVVTSCFYCKRCCKVYIFPSILSHSCKLIPFVDPPRPPSTDLNYEDCIKDLLRVTGRWNTENVEIDGDLTESIIEAFGLDPFRATPQEMDQLKTRISCKLCDRDIRPIMSWRAAVVHYYTQHSEKTPKWDSVDEEELKMAEPLEANAAIAYEKAPLWYCRHCPTTLSRSYGRTKSSAETHLLQSHGIENAAQDDIYYDGEKDPAARSVYFISDRAVYIWGFGPPDVETAHELGYAKICTHKTSDLTLPAMSFF
ncbi:hypothetical protein ABKN59_002771 [Abortiporus biennis]